MTSVLPLADVMTRWRPGSYDEPWTWLDESDELWATQPERMDALANDVQSSGIHDPVILGNDGRVWDGHHRIVVAQALGLDNIPVEVWSPPASDNTLTTPPAESRPS